MDSLFKTSVMVLPPWPIVAAKQCSCCDRDWPITTILLGLISISRRFPGLYSLTKSLRQANRLQEAMQSSFSVIQQCGEELPLPIGNKKLDNKMQSMNQILQNTEDKSILGMVEASNKKVAILLKLYADLANLLFFVEPSLIGAISLRMIELTLTSGLTSESPLAFAFYAGTLTSMGDQHVHESCRLGE